MLIKVAWISGDTFQSAKHGRFLTIRYTRVCYTRDKMRHLFWGGGFQVEYVFISLPGMDTRGLAA